MILRRLTLRKFRNYAEEGFEPSPVLTVLWGANAQGKTNLLEAVYLLSTTQSFRTSQTRDLIAEGAAEASVAGDIETPVGASKVQVTLAPGGKRVARDGKAVRARKDLFGMLPAVVFSPEDLFLLRGPSERRRRTLDLAISSLSLPYFEALRDFQKALAQRNALLKEDRLDREGFEAWTETYARLAASVTRRRLAYLRDLEPRVAEGERAVSGKEGSLRLVYEPSAVVPEDGDEEACAAAYRAALREKESEERRRQVSLLGPQRDDFRAELEGRDLAAYGSQGQHRTFAIAFKLAETRALAEALRTDPLFLLDDVSSELDEARSARLTEALLASPSQVILTATRREWAPPGSASGTRRFRVERGRLFADD